MRIPELANSAIRDSCERAGDWRTPVGGQDRFPHNLDAQIPLGMFRQKLLGCGGPPQTCWSSGREQQDEQRRGARRIRGHGEPAEILRGEGKKRRLARRNH